MIGSRSCRNHSFSCRSIPFCPDHTGFLPTVRTGMDARYQLTFSSNFTTANNNNSSHKVGLLWICIISVLIAQKPSSQREVSLNTSFRHQSVGMHNRTPFLPASANSQFPIVMKPRLPIRKQKETNLGAQVAAKGGSKTFQIRTQDLPEGIKI